MQHHSAVHQSGYADQQQQSVHFGAVNHGAPTMYLPYLFDQQPQQRMWPLVRRIFPSEENLIRFLFAAHLAFLAFFTLDRNVQLNNWYLEVYNTFFLYFLSAVLFLALFWTLLVPRDYNPMDLAQLTELVAIGADSYVLYKLYSRYSFEAHAEKFVYWHIIFIFRLFAFVLLRKMWADRCTAAMETQGLHQNPRGRTLTPPPQLFPANQKPSVRSNLASATGNNREYPIGSRDAYLYQASLNA